MMMKERAPSIHANFRVQFFFLLVMMHMNLSHTFFFAGNLFMISLFKLYVYTYMFDLGHTCPYSGFTLESVLVVLNHMQSKQPTLYISVPPFKLYFHS